MFKPSEELKKYLSRRDEATRGLTKCEVYLSPSELEESGFKSLLSEYYEEEGDEYEYHLYEKNGQKVVCIQVYEDREGGMYHQVMYTHDGKLPE